MRVSRAWDWCGNLGGLALAAFLPALAAGAEVSSSQPAVLRQVKEALELPPEELRKDRAVDLELVLTCIDSSLGLLFGQDQTSGIHLYFAGGKERLDPGDVVRVQGAVRPGTCDPFVDVRELQRTGRRAMPAPRAVEFGQVLFGGLSSQYVEVVGVVRREGVFSRQLRLHLGSGDSRLTATVSNYTNASSPNLMDCLVRARGVVVTQNDPDKQVGGFALMVNDLADVTVEERADGDVFARRRWFARDLRTFQVRKEAEHRVRVQGSVTFYWPGRALVVEDSTGGVEVETDFMGELALGDVADVGGFLAGGLDAARLERASVQRAAVGRPVDPVRLTLDQAAKGNHRNRLVEFEARLLHHGRIDPGSVTLVVQDGPQVLTACLPPPVPRTALSSIENGSMLRLTGVLRLEASRTESAPSLHLWLRSPADVRLVAGPDAPGGTRLAWLAGGLGAVVLVVLVVLAWLYWINARQRRCMERVLNTQRQLQAEIQEGDEWLRRSIQERERMGQDMHDDVIQSIFAVGLGLESVRRKAGQIPAEVDERLKAAIGSLNEIIRSLRSVIAGLEPKVLNGRELKTALKSLALATGETQCQFSIEVHPAVASSLTPNEATMFLHIAKEAVSNTLRHATASQLSVALKPVADGVRLEIVDDGVGFETHRPESRGQGLRNMASRAASLGGRCTIDSAPGRGCRIAIDIPKMKNHDSD